MRNKLAFVFLSLMLAIPCLAQNKTPAHSIEPNFPLITNTEGTGWINIDSIMAQNFVLEAIRLKNILYGGNESTKITSKAPTEAFCLVPLVNQYKVENPPKEGWVTDSKPTCQAVAVAWESGQKAFAWLKADPKPFMVPDGLQFYNFGFRVNAYSEGKGFEKKGWYPETAFAFAGKGQNETQYFEELRKSAPAEVQAILNKLKIR